MADRRSEHAIADKESRTQLRAGLVGYGLLGTALKHVSEVSRGLACGCNCVECGRPLIAKKGSKRAAHFAHHEASTCDGGVETLLHRLAKETFQQIAEMELPAYEYSRSGLVNLERVRYSATVRPSRRVSFSRVDTEEPLSGLIPDIVVWNAKHPLIIEIAVSHRVDQPKLDRIKALGIPAIEIRLSASDSLLTREELRVRIESDVACKHWLFHPLEAVHEQRFLARMEQAKRHAANVQERARRVRDALFDSRRESSRSQRLKPRTSISFLETEAAIDRFFQHHGRYPTLAESKRLFLGGGTSTFKSNGK